MKSNQTSYIKITKIKDGFYAIVNKKQEVEIGTIAKLPVGRFQHWCLIPRANTYFTNGCLKEISKFITKLYKK